MDYGKMTLDEYLKEKKEEYLANKEHELFMDRFNKYDDVIRDIVKRRYKKVPDYYVVNPLNLEKLKLEHKEALICAEILQCAIDAAKKSMDKVIEVMKDGSEENDN